MGRRILAVLAGLAASVIMVILGDLFHHQFYPPPEGFDPSNAEAIVEFASTLPFEAFMLMLLTWAASVFVAGFVASKIAPAHWLRVSLIVGVVALAGAVANLMAIPHPMWMNITTVIMYIPLAYLGGRLGG